jgi:hypothetical protein
MRGWRTWLLGFLAASVVAGLAVSIWILEAAADLERARSARVRAEARIRGQEQAGKVHQAFSRLEASLASRLRARDRETKSYGVSPAHAMRAVRQIGWWRLVLSEWRADAEGISIVVYSVAPQAPSDLARALHQEVKARSAASVFPLPPGPADFVPKYIIWWKRP